MTGPSASRPTVSLAIPCFNAAATLEAVLDGVAALDRAADELLLIDDGSTDPSARLAGQRAGVRVIAHETNRGLAAARNSALAAASGEVVVFLDADAIPDPDLLTRLTAGYDDPTLVGVGGQLIEVRRGALADRWRSIFWRQTQGDAPLAQAPFVVGACCSLRRRAALAVGGFSAGFHTNGEDVELSVRLRRAGGRLAYDPQARAQHLRHDDLQSLLAMVFRHSRDHVCALRVNDEPSRHVVLAAARWGPVTLLSSLRRHRSPGLALLSPLCYGAALAGCAVGVLADRAAGRLAGEGLKGADAPLRGGDPAESA